MRQGITALILTRNEELALGACIDSLEGLAEDIAVIDSDSVDSTTQVAREHGARVVPFRWNGDYPKKKEWAMRHAGVTTEWILLLDADERVSAELADELLHIACSPPAFSAYDVPITYYWRKRRLQHGQTVYKRSFLRTGHCSFPTIPDLAAKGITEVEGHYQPMVDGAIGITRGRILHDDPDPVTDWFARHNRYSDWEAYLRTHPDARETVRRYRTKQGRLFERLPLKPLAIFAYNYVLRQGWKDGRVGFEYATSLAFYQFQIGVKVREIRDGNIP